MADPDPKTSPLLMVVEGINDLHVIKAIAARRSFEPEFAIQPEGSDESLLKALPVRLIRGTHVLKLGIVVDADADASRRWQSIRGVLEKAGYQDLNDHPDPAGTVVEREIPPKVGVWIMPDNSLPGMIEDFLKLLVPDDDALIDHARASIDAIPAEQRRFPAVRDTKALIHNWLAWQEEPGKPMGQAITARYFSTDGPHVAAFLDWLTRVFG